MPVFLILSVTMFIFNFMECYLNDLSYLRTGGAKIRALSTLDSREMGVCPEGKIAEKRREERKCWNRREAKGREKRGEERRQVKE